MAKELKCTEYIYLDTEEWPVPPCKCPVCGGFLKWEGEDFSIPVCNKCHTELLMIPERDDETDEELEWGKICPISSRKKEAKK